MLKFGRLGSVGILVAVLLLLAQSQAVGESPVSLSASEYIVQAGDSFWSIGQRFGVDPENLAQSNEMDLSEPLEVGQSLEIPETTVKTYQVKAGENLWTIAGRYGIPVTTLVQANNVENPDRLQIGQALLLPSRTVISRGTAVTSAVSGFAWPITGPITSRFGWRKGVLHTGLDIAADIGTEITAAKGGTVVYAGWANGYGLVLKLDHGDGYETLYAHTSKLLVRLGDHVYAGQAIARVGSTGNSTGPHLHFEVRRGGTAVNPMNLLNNSSMVAAGY